MFSYLSDERVKAVLGMAHHNLISVILQPNNGECNVCYVYIYICVMESAFEGGICV